MLFPKQRPRSFNPGPMQQGSNNSMFPNRGLSQPTQRNNIQSMVQHFTQPQASANIVNKGVGGLSKTLTNVQQVLKVVESTAPIVKEYGPMVKNLPAMYKMIKAFKEIESTDEELVEDKEEQAVQGDQYISQNDAENDTAFKPNNDNGMSTPKLFI
ncbi:hypothetical protein CIL05_11290 [Virgibacillus profundi]|uniref:YqfQ-like protein n=1 Tax=Virgibacillus profundi TaxID=2024555 RepID=A0A2A2IDV9_9BACI|nr:VrrA/YqfQ family protein [Virgibacillus profundi]PAV29444.1 hypothetical protein CIL05_11290 [Virgibacillus profundi]PXY53613.1 hypothetical protein CIT14_11400 [Virgibacillus profundi]